MHIYKHIYIYILLYSRLTKISRVWFRSTIDRSFTSGLPLVCCSYHISIQKPWGNTNSIPNTQAVGRSSHYAWDHRYFSKIRSRCVHGTNTMVIIQYKDIYLCMYLCRYGYRYLYLHLCISMYVYLYLHDMYTSIYIYTIIYICIISMYTLDPLISLS